MKLILFVIMPIIFSLLAYLFHKAYSKMILLLSTFALFIMSIFLFSYVHKNGIYMESLGGYKTWQGINLKADEISVLFVVLTCFLFMIIFIYGYSKEYLNKLYMFLFFLLEGLINGIFLVDDFFSIYTLIELSTVCVAILIMFKKSKQSIYDGMVYLLINIVAMNFYLLGVGYIYKIFGSLNMGFVRDAMALIDEPKDLIIPYALLITAIGLKSAIMPLFSWLPKAHGTPSAPSEVSAILSALYVKCGVYLLIRVNFIFNPIIDVSEVFVILGFLTGIAGFVLALSQTDIKLILAYHTVSQIGLIIFGLSISSIYSYYGAIYHIINHAVFKSTLFLTAGMIYNEYGTRNITKIRGVFRRMPYVSIVTLIAIFGITGAPLFNGSISKYLISRATVKTSLYELAFIIMNIGTVLSFVKYSTIFFGESKKKISIAFTNKVAIGALAIVTFLGGVFGEQIIEFLFGFPIIISSWDMAKKFGIYFVNIVLGILFYIYIYPKITYFKKIREFEVSFNGLIMSIFIFFIAFTGYLYIAL